VRVVEFQFQSIEFDPTADRAQLFASLPRRSGVFRVFDLHDNLILLEKTHDLARRIDRSYNSEQRDGRTLDLRQITGRIEFCRTDSPLETLYLLYLQRRRWFPDTYHRMRTFPLFRLMKINLRQRFPRIYASRQIKDGVDYFGPFLSRAQLENLKTTLERTFKLRPCLYNIRGNDPYPDCLYFQMNTCSRPCNGDIGRAAYLDDVKDAIAFVQGRDDDITGPILERIRMLSEATRFEDAEHARRRLERIHRARKQHPHTFFDVRRFDFVIVMESDSVKRRKIALVRAGRIVSLEEHTTDELANGFEDWLQDRLKKEVPERGANRQYDEFCLVANYIVRPVKSVQIVRLVGDTANTAAVITRNLNARKKKKTDVDIVA
jgi:excinuclease ABC subunit C